MVNARKRFGQHFLEPAWVTKLIDAIAPSSTDRFIEIGPGRGAITDPLAARVQQLIAIEVDRDLAAALRARGRPNTTVIQADVLDVDLVAIAQQHGAPPLRIAGNLPYNISSPILLRLLDASTSGLFMDATLMLQKEVADRLAAQPGTGDYGVLTLSTMIRAEVTRLLSLPPGAFRPPPKVRSAVVRLAFRPPPSDVRNPQLLIQIVRSVFTQRRKTMTNALTPFAASRSLDAGSMLRTAGIDGQRRPETLTLSEYARLAEVVAVL